MAPILEWHPKFSVGLDEIDLQHKKLFQLTNALAEAVRAKANSSLVEAVLDEMAEYINEHFKFEQSFLEKHPDFKDHLSEHWQFAKKTVQLSKEFCTDSTTITQDTLDYLAGWLTNHIVVLDIEYFRYLRENNLLPDQE